MLTGEQIAFFEANGYLVVEDVVTPDLLAGLRRDFANWVEESCDHAAAYGRTQDRRACFDVEAGHIRDRQKPMGASFFVQQAGAAAAQ